MKAVILAGGYGSRLGEETDLKPKPMVEIGGKPILWHIMKLYSFHGVNEFIICIGYKGYQIKEYFLHYALHNSNVTISTKSGDLLVHKNQSEDWKITIVDTGENTMTGGRLKRISEYIDEDNFCFTYGDGVCNVPISSLIDYHKRHKKLATITAVKPPGRFGVIEFDTCDENEDQYVSVKDFKEKPVEGGGWINGGYFVLNRQVLEYIDGDECIWERDPLHKLVSEKQLITYKHDGFWQAMDTLRDKRLLQSIWDSGSAPWKVW